MKAWQVLDETMERGDQKAIAHALDLSPQLVHSWTLPPRREGGEGNISPLERAAEIVEAMRRNGNTNAHLLVDWFADRLGYVAIQTEILGGEFHSLRDIAEVMRECADLLRSVADAAADGVITDPEREAIHAHVRRVIVAAMSVDVKLHPAQEVRL